MADTDTGKHRTVCAEITFFANYGVAGDIRSWRNRSIFANCHIMPNRHIEVQHDKRRQYDVGCEDRTGANYAPFAKHHVSTDPYTAGNKRGKSGTGCTEPIGDVAFGRRATNAQYDGMSWTFSNPIAPPELATH